MDFTLEFERPIVELRKRIHALREMERVQGADLSDAIEQLERQADVLLEQVFSSLTPWQETLLSRHPARPYPLDYIDGLFTDWTGFTATGRYDDHASSEARPIREHTRHGY